MNVGAILGKLWGNSGFAAIITGFVSNNGWQNLVMLAIACVLLYLAIVKKFEPLLLVGIAFGCLLSNLPSAGLYHQELWDAFMDPSNPAYHSFGAIMRDGGLIDIFYIGVKTSLYPCLIFMGVGAMTDFGPLIANPKSFLLGAAAQFGIYAAYFMAIFMGFNDKAAAAISIIGGADGPTSIFLAGKLGQTEFMGPIAVAAYSYMALVPIIQPMVIKTVTTKNERLIRMPYQPGKVSRLTRILFPIIVTFVAGVVAPASVSLVGCLMFGNLIRECGALNSLSETAQGTLANLITLLLGITISFSMRAEFFVTPQTVMIMALGLFAFIFDTIGGVLFAKLLNLFSKNKINPMIGAAGISAFPMSARVIEKMGVAEDKSNHLLMHAIGANVSGQVASAVAGGIILGFFM